MLSKPVVTCTIVDATKPRHLQDAAAALNLNLTDGELKEFEERYTPEDNYGGDV